MKFASKYSPFAFLLLVLLFTYCFFSEKFSLQWFTHLSPQAVMFCGFFTCMMTFSISRVLKLDVLSWLFAFGIFLLVSVSSFDSRTVRLMLESPRRLSSAGIRYCPSEVEQPPKPAPSKKISERKPGCELIYRAFELGYVKSLGSCAAGANVKEGAKLEICTARQIDEPLVHYSYRLLGTFLEKEKVELLKPDLKGRLQETFERQLEHTDSLLGKLKNVVKSAPKSSHHLFTNLPYPRGAADYYWEKWFHQRDCLTEYRKLSHTIDVPAGDPRSTSLILEHVYGQMLFNPKYSASVGNCLEYTIHWNAPMDSCQRLAANAVGFLKETGIYPDVATVLHRVDEQKDFHKLQYQLIFMPLFRSLRPIPPTAAEIEKILPKVGRDYTPEQVISFQCLMKVPARPLNGNDLTGTGSASATSDAVLRKLPFQIEGHRFDAREMTFSKDPQSERVFVTLFKDFSELLADNFKYAGYLSHENASYASLLNTSSVDSSFFSAGDFPLTRLEYLKGLDIFVDHDWLQSRPDLLEIYPYYHHLYNFIEIFRKQYHLQRTRL